jgi:hypothetical protein
MKRRKLAIMDWFGVLLSEQAGFRSLAEPAAPLPPASVPPNASHIVATVVAESVWRERHAELPVVDSLTVRIHTSRSVSPNLASLAAPDAVLEALASDAVATGLQGKRIAATLIMTLDGLGVRWWISNVRLLP